MRGSASIIKIETAPVADGKIHHWVGAVFVPGVTVDAAIERLERRAGHESESYDDVLASRVMERNGDRVRVFMKLSRTSVITVTYNTEHVVDYTRVTGTRALVRSVATKIAELADAGTAQEREKAAGGRQRISLAPQCVLALRSRAGGRDRRMRIGEPQPCGALRRASCRQSDRRSHRAGVAQSDADESAGSC